MLAILGGSKIRDKSFMSRPHIDKKERGYIDDCLENKIFSRFIGSPVGNYRELLSLTSEKAANVEDFWSVLGGVYTRKFEAEFARKHEVKYAISSNSATSSIISALIACNIKARDEVITSPFSFTATSTAIKIAGGTVVFADIDPNTFCITLESIKKRITKKTKAVVVVNLLGNAGDIIAINEFCDKNSLILIEDSAQALHSKKNGKYLGTYGDVGIFSFQETKNIMTGEGGMAITNDAEIAYKLRLVRNHGESMVFNGIDSQDTIEAAVGYNFRLPELLSAIGYAQTQKIEMLNGIRRENYFFLKEKLAHFNFLSLVEVTNDDYEFYPYCLGMVFNHEEIHRDLFAEALRAEGIPVSTGFPRLLNENPFTQENVELTPVANEINNNCYLGFFQIGYPNTISDMQDIVDGIAKIENNFNILQQEFAETNQVKEFNSGRV